MIKDDFNNLSSKKSLSMESEFFKKSKEIANDYIQSIVFLDDRAYNKEEGQQSDIHDLSAVKISSLFAKERKICAFYDPVNLNDIDNFKEIAQKADIVILDWFIDLIEEHQGDTIDLEEDATDDDVRGKYTKEVITSIIDKIDNDSLKLVVVYTGETNLVEIVNEIGSLTQNAIINEENCEVFISNVKILVRAKSNNDEQPDQRFKHLTGLQDKVLNYHSLPTFVLEEFAKMTAGLLSNFVLKALTILRNNSSKILGLFDKNLDPAYLSHQSLITHKEEANELLVELLKDAIGSLLKYEDVNKILDSEFIEDWLKANIVEKEKSIIKSNGEVDSTKKYLRNIEFLMSILKLSSLTDKEYKQEYEKLMNLNKTGDFWIKHHISYFSDLKVTELSEISKKFAILTHHKSLYIPTPYVPHLSLGSVCQSKKSYYVCIQQRCDSVRVFEAEGRRFLFIPLVKSESKFDVITPDGVKLRISDKSYSLRTVKFVGDDNGLVKANLIGNEYYFQQKYTEEHDEKFRWVFDLKDLHAQSIISGYSSQISRVGIEESEWLRRS